MTTYYIILTLCALTLVWVISQLLRTTPPKSAVKPKGKKGIDSRNFIHRNIRRTNRNTTIQTIAWLGLMMFLFYCFLFENLFERLNIIGQILIPIGSIWIFFISISTLLNIVMYIQNPLEHPARKNMILQGDYEEVTKSIETQISDTTQVIRAYPDILITKEWLIKNGRYEFMPIYLEDIVWVYKKVIKKSWNFIPVGKDYALIIKTNKGLSVEMPLAGYEVDILMRYIFERYSDIIWGHKDEYEAIWEQEPQNFVNAIVLIEN